MAMPDNIWRNDDTLFYVPNYPIDTVQSVIVDTGTYFEIDDLLKIKKYIPRDATIFDIGANIGNHSIFFAKELNAKKVIAFEPIKETYDILQKNIELNSLQDKIIANNFGLSNENTNAKIQNFEMNNIGGASLKKDATGNISLQQLDDYDFSQIDKIDFIKIDVEGHEVLTLEGAMETLKRYKPVIFIETFEYIEDSKRQHYINKDKVFSILEKIGYTMVEQLNAINYIFKIH